MRVLIIGAGMMGKAAAYDLVRNKHITSVRIADANTKAVKKLVRWLGSKKVESCSLDAKNKKSIERAMKDCDMALSCIPYFFNYTLAQIAIKQKVHFFDLGGNNDIVQKELSLHTKAKKAGVLIVPDCGLAPGLVSVFTKHLYEEMDKIHTVQLRVGGLPQKPEGPLKYAHFFAIPGLINEYVEPVVRLRNGKKETIEPLADEEEIVFPRPFGKMEAFSTSGGTSTLPKTYKGKIRNLDYKTIRYPGHCNVFRTFYEVGFMDSTPVPLQGQQISPRALLEKLLCNYLEEEKRDVILLRAVGIGTHKGKKTSISYEIIDKYNPRMGLTGMMRCTTFPVTSLMHLLATGKITTRGVHTQEHFVPTKLLLQEIKKRGIVIKRSQKKI